MPYIPTRLVWQGAATVIASALAFGGCFQELKGSGRAKDAGIDAAGEAQDKTYDTGPQPDGAISPAPKTSDAAPWLEWDGGGDTGSPTARCEPKACESFQSCLIDRCSPRYGKTIILGPGITGIHDVHVVDGAATYVIGSFEKKVDFDPSTQSEVLDGGEGSLFVVRFDSQGRFQWVRSIRGNVRIANVATTPTGALVLVGDFWESATFSGTPEMMAPVGGFNFAFSLDELGSPRLRVFNESPAGNWRLSAVAAVGGSAFLLGGYFSGSFRFENGGFAYSAPAGASYGFLATADPDWKVGTTQLFATIGSGRASVNGVCPLADGRVWVVGSGRGMVDLDPGGSVKSADLRSGADFAVLLNQARSFSSSGVIERDLYEFSPTLRCSAGKDGRVVLWGQHYSDDGVLDLDPGANRLPVTSKGDFDFLVSVIDQDANIVWGDAWGGIGYDWLNTASTNDRGELLLAGSFSGTVNLGRGTTELYAQSTNGSAFMLRLGSQGEFLGTAGLGGAKGAAWARPFAKGVVVAGTFQGDGDFDPGVAADTRNSPGTSLFVTWFDE